MKISPFYTFLFAISTVALLLIVLALFDAAQPWREASFAALGFAWGEVYEAHFINRKGTRQ